MSSPRYYSPSGRFSPSGLAILVAASGGAAAVGGALYGAISRVNPFIYVNLLGVIFLGIGLGALVEKLGRDGKIRNRLILLGVGLFTGVVSLYFAWIFYLYALTVQVGDPFWAFNPLVFVGMMLALLENGAWSMGDFTPTGFLLGTVWAIEAALMVGFPVSGAGGANEEPFCEDCGEWMEVSQAVRVGDSAGRDDEVREACERGDFSVFTRLPFTEAENTTVYSKHACPTCRSQAYLQVQRVHVIPDGQGGADENRVVTVKYLHLSPAANEELDAVTELLLAPAPPPQEG